MCLRILEGSIFDSSSDYLVHQCNCMSERSAHLAADVFRRYPWADVYTGRATKDTPGTIKICGNGEDQRFVINLFGQVYPGASKFDTGEDTYEKRRVYFRQGLMSIFQQVPSESELVFPWKIGCGAAGADWSDYLGILSDFSFHARREKLVTINVMKHEKG